MGCFQTKTTIPYPVDLTIKRPVTNAEDLVMTEEEGHDEENPKIIEADAPYYYSSALEGTPVTASSDADTEMQDQTPVTKKQNIVVHIKTFDKLPKPFPALNSNLVTLTTL